MTALKPLPQRSLRQAEGDLQAARDSLRAEHFNWACFQAQQSVEKAIKALLYLEGRISVRTHVIVDLIKEAVKHHSELATLTEAGKFLDTVYQRARYPDSLDSDLTPEEYFDQRAFQADAFQSNAFQTTAVDAEKCLSYAESILTAVKRYFRTSTGP